MTREFVFCAGVRTVATVTGGELTLDWIGGS